MSMASSSMALAGGSKPNGSPNAGKAQSFEDLIASQKGKGSPKARKGSPKARRALKRVDTVMGLGGAADEDGVKLGDTFAKPQSGDTDGGSDAGESPKSESGSASFGTIASMAAGMASPRPKSAKANRTDAIQVGIRCRPLIGRDAGQARCFKTQKRSLEADPEVCPGIDPKKALPWVFDNVFDESSTVHDIHSSMTNEGALRHRAAEKPRPALPLPAPLCLMCRTAPPPPRRPLTCFPLGARSVARQ